MSFHIFISESVDVAIYEVGMGGEYDATNIIERPAVTGISALGIDHTFHLGNTIDSIAWHKAGIFKKNVPAYSVEQPLEAMPVLASRAQEAETDGFFVVKEYALLKGVKIEPDAAFQRQNASLAIALSKKVLEKVNPSAHITWPETQLPPEFIHGLENLASRGRCETIVTDKVIWYLDGAHTADSITIASQWFCSSVQNKYVCSSPILIFH
jgi:folylpolyglutamate synthase